MQIKNLRPNRLNPRKLSSKKKSLLKASVEEFGDLGGIVFNTKSNQLVGAHQRTSVLPENSKIVIERRYDVPTRTGTVAEGYVEANGEKFSYREVSWDKKKETEALLAANKHGGAWDQDLMKVLVADVPDLSLDLAGFEMSEMKSMNIEFKMPEIEVPKFEEQTDEQYVKNTPQITEQIDTENIPSIDHVDSTKAFEDVKEKTEVVGKRFVIIVDCPNQEVKDAMREKLQPQINEAGCKIF